MSDVEQLPPFEDEDDALHSSEAEIIEAEAGLETPAAPTGEASWAEDTSPEDASPEQAAGEQSEDRPG